MEETIIEYIFKSADDYIEAVILINGLIEKFKDKIPRLASDFMTALLSKCEELNICPRCGNDIEYNTGSEQSEYFGRPSIEIVVQGAKCTSCDWSEKY